MSHQAEDEKSDRDSAPPNSSNTTSASSSATVMPLDEPVVIVRLHPEPTTDHHPDEPPGHTIESIPTISNTPDKLHHDVVTHQNGLTGTHDPSERIISLDIPAAAASSHTNSTSNLTSITIDQPTPPPMNNWDQPTENNSVSPHATVSSSSVSSSKPPTRRTDSRDVDLLDVRTNGTSTPPRRTSHSGTQFSVNDITTIHIKPATPRLTSTNHELSVYVDSLEEKEFDETHTAMPPILELNPGYQSPFPYTHRPSVSYSGISSKLRRVPSLAHRSFQYIPDDILCLTLEFLSSRDLCAATRINRRIRDLSTRNSVWALRCGFMQKPEVVQAPFLLTKMYNQTRFKTRFLLYRNWKIASIETEYHRSVKSLRQRKLMCCLHWCDGPLFFLVIGVFMVMGFGLTVRYIEANQGVGPLDFTAVWPYYVVLGFTLFVTICVCIARMDRFSNKCCHPSTYLGVNGNPGSQGVVAIIIREFLGDNSNQLIVSGCMYLFFLLWGVLFLLRLCDYISWSYYRVFTPLFFDFGLLACMCYHPLSENLSWRDRIGGCCFSWVLIGPICAFVILVTFRLESGIVIPVDAGDDGHALSWMYIMIPLFFLNLLVCIASFGISLDERSANACIAGCCCWGPILAFEVLIAHWLDTGGFSGANSPPFTNLFIPLWIIMSLCLLVSLVIALVNRPPTTSCKILSERSPEREPLLL